MKVFKDENGAYYMPFGGIWGGQLQHWITGVLKSDHPESPFAFILQRMTLHSARPELVDDKTALINTIDSYNYLLI